MRVSGWLGSTVPGDMGGPDKARRSLSQRLEHDPEKWEPVFGKDHAPQLERDDDSKKSHPALALEKSQNVFR
jgi:hypothetical protein